MSTASDNAVENEFAMIFHQIHQMNIGKLDRTTGIMTLHATLGIILISLKHDRNQIIKTLEWMVDKHQYYLCLRNNAPDDPSEYPEELQEAIDLLAELKGEK